MMDLARSTAHREFRAQVRAELADPAISAELARLRAEGLPEPDARPLYRLLGDRGLLAVNWPKEYGGRDLGVIEATIVAEELIHAGIPDTLHVLTIQIVGLFLHLAGTEQQKARFLPGFAAGERFASVLYTEPGSGSDLASLATTAVRDGTGYRLNGVKVFNLKSHLTDIALCAARTSKGTDRHQGISLFLVDLHAEGVRREPIAGIADEQFNRVELHDVHVEADCLLGQEGAGWPLLTQALAIERTGLDYSLKAERWLRALTDQVVTAAGREQIARLAAAVRASRLLAWKILTRLDERPADGVNEGLAAIAKLYGSELAQDVAHEAARLGADDEVLTAAFREAPGLTLSAGTSQIMMSIIASSGDDVDLDDDPLQRQLRAVVRERLGTVPVPVDVHAEPYDGSCECPSWGVLRELSAHLFEVPVSAGGLHLGLGAALVVCEELGRLALGGPYRSMAARLDLLCTQGADATGIEQALADPHSTPLVDAPPQVMARQRIRQAAYLVGLADGARLIATDYTRRRRQFGRALHDFQGISFALANATAQVTAARLGAYHAGSLSDAEEPFQLEAAQSLAMAAEIALSTVRLAMQVVGVRSMTAELGLHRHYRVARVEAVRLGTSATLWQEAAELSAAV